MPEIGRRNTLRVIREATPGLYLDGEELGEILLPRRYIPDAIQLGDKLDIFLHLDSEDRLVATTETPHAMVGDFACLRVVAVTPGIGAFLDWGLAKDLLLPIREQEHRVHQGDWVVAYVYVDEESGRIVASTRLSRHLSPEPPEYSEGQPVQLLIARETPLGYQAIVENAHWGLLYHSELAGPLQIGEKLRGYVRAVREDGKLDLGLDPAGYGRVAPLAYRIIQALEKSGGHLDFDDQSTPESIRAAFGTSKKAFKQALGALLRERRIRFVDDGIALVEEKPAPKGKKR
jgi:predicted RNA-binding protein (virulence factor B family)